MSSSVPVALLGPWSNPTYGYETDRRAGSEHAVSTRTACSHFARFARIIPHSLASLLARASSCPPRLLCSLRSPPRLCWPALSLRSRLPPRLLASLALPAARFARPTFPAARAARRLSCCPPSLRSGRLRPVCSRAPLDASPACALASLHSSARLLLAPLAASTAAAAGCLPLAVPSTACFSLLRSPSTC